MTNKLISRSLTTICFLTLCCLPALSKGTEKGQQQNNFDNLDSLEKKFSQIFEEQQKEMESLFNQSFSRFKDLDDPSFNDDSDLFTLNWQDKNNTKILEIDFKGQTPVANIKIQEGSLFLSAKLTKKVINKDDQGESSFYSTRSFAQTIPLEQNLNTDKAKIDQKEDKIIVTFPVKNSKDIANSKTSDKSDTVQEKLSLPLPRSIVNGNVI